MIVVRTWANQKHCAKKRRMKGAAVHSMAIVVVFALLQSATSGSS
jgi:hypothetical protein